MPGIIGPSRAGVTTPQDVVNSMRPGAGGVVSRGGGSFYNPATMMPVNQFAGMTLRQKQQYLVDHGFDIDVDGMWGPQTAGAWKNLVALLKKRGTNKATKSDGIYWSKNSKLSNSWKDVVKKVVKADVPVVEAKPTTTTGSGRTTTTTKTGGKGVVINPLNLAAQLAQLQKNLIDPKQFMNMVTSGQQPALDALQAEITRRETRGPSTVDDNLRRWYEAMIGQVNAGAGATSAAGERILAGHDAATNALVNTLGGSASPAASSAASFGNIARGELAAGIQAQDAFEASQGRNLALEGVEKRMGARQEDQDALDELRMKMIELQGGQGADKAQAWLQALQLRDQQVNSIADMKAIQNMAAADAAAKGQSLTAGALANRAAALDIDINAAKLAAGIANLKEGAIPAFTKLDPAKMQGLKKELISGLINDKNELLVDPMTVYNQMGAALRGLSHGKWNPYNDKRVDQFRDDLLKSLLPSWNRLHPKKRWAFTKKGKLVRI